MIAEDTAKNDQQNEQELFLGLDEPIDKIETNNGTILKPPPDGGYGWVILAASFSISLFLDAILYSSGILVAEIGKYYQISNFTSSILSSLYTGFYLLCGPLVGGIVNQYGCQVAIISGAVVTSLMYFVSIFSPNIYFMYASIGVIGGCSTGLLYISSLLIIPQYFDKKCGIANGITMAGSGIGFFIGPPIIEKLIKLFSWKVAYAFCALVILTNAFIGILSKPLNPPISKITFGKKKRREIEIPTVEIMSGSVISLKKEIKRVNSQHPDQKQSVVFNLFKEIIDMKLLKENWRFLFMTLSNLFVFTGFFLPFLSVTKIAEKNGIPNPSWILSIIGGGNIPSRLAFGSLADAKFVTPITLNTISLFLGAVSVLPYDLYLQHSFMSQAIFASLYSLATAGCTVLATPYLKLIVGSEKVSNAMGIVCLFRGIGCLIGPSIGGIIADNYTEATAFYFSGICYIIGLIFSAIVSLAPVKVEENTKSIT